MKRFTRTMVLCESLQIIIASIAGVTYMDRFDFEQRYKDVNECNPFYWHPLHLPEECVQMFERLIRSRLNTMTPLRILKERTTLATNPLELNMYPYNNIRVYNPVPRTIEYLQPFEIRYQSPFEEMFALLERDVRDLPSAPTLGVSPYLGLIAMYKQPVSYKSVAMIKKLARAYADSGYSGAASEFEIDNSNHHQENKDKINTKVVNGTLYTDNVMKGNNVAAFFKIKKI